MNDLLSFSLEPGQQGDHGFRGKFGWPGVDELRTFPAARRRVSQGA